MYGMVFKTRAFPVSVVLAVALLSLFTLQAKAAINEEITFYGTLQNSGGGNLTGTYDMVFRFYDAASGGTLLDTSTHTAGNGNAISVSDGEFIVQLGSGTGNALDGIDFNSASIYVGLTVAGDSEMTPRRKLSAAPYAFNSGLLSGQDGNYYLDNSFSSTSADYWETTQTARNADDISNDSLETLNDVASITKDIGDLLYWTGSAWDGIATSSLGIAGGGGTVTSVAATVPTGFTVTGSPITGAGTLAFAYAAGYEGLLTASSTEWATAFAWGDHSLVGYLLSSSIDTSLEILNIIGDETGTGALVFASSPSLTTPTISGANVSGTFTTTGTLTIGDNGDSIVIDASNWDVSSGGTISGATWQGNIISSNYLDNGVILGSEIDTSAELAGLLTDETGTGFAVFSTSPTLTGTLTAAAANFSGNVGIGTTTPFGKLHIASANSGAASASTAGDELVLEGTLETGMTILSGITRDTGIYFGDTDNSVRGRVVYRNAFDELAFYANSAEFLTIKSTGNVGIGTSSPSYKLDIVGTLRSSGDARINGLTVGLGGGAQTSNTAVGLQALNSNTSGGTANVAIGSNALFFNTTADDNVAVGSYALWINNGADNTAVGSGAMFTNTSGQRNTAIGKGSLTSNQTGRNNTAGGHQSLLLNTSGFFNTAFGDEALRSNTTGYYNTAIGTNALYDANTTGTTGGNTALGYNTGRGIVTGTNNTILGANVTGLSSTLSNNIIIADGAGNRRINVDSVGNVGMGTASSSVGGTAANAGRTYLTLKGPSGSGVLQLTSSSADADGTGLGNLEWVDSNSTHANKRVAYISVLSSGATANNRGSYLAFATRADNGSQALERFKITNTGDTILGVAGGTPRARFDIVGSTADNTAKAFNVRNLSAVDMFTVVNNGNVGVGTTTPATKLSVVGDSTFTGKLNLKGAGTDFAIYNNNNDLRFEGNGSISWIMTNASFTGNGGSGSAQLINGVGRSALNPVHTFTGDTNTGMFNPGDEIIGFSTNGTERLRIDSSGNVGIGTTTPSAKLHVYGNNENVNLTNTNTAATAAYQLYENNTLKGIFRYRGTTNGTRADVLEIGGIGGAATAFVSGGGAERMRIDASGNVGIGTTTPQKKLSVEGNIFLSGNNSYGSALAGNLYAQLYHSDSLGLVLGGDGSTNDVTLTNAAGQTFLANISGTQNSYFVGNVGIGTTTPANKLTVDGIISSTVALAVNSGASSAQIVANSNAGTFREFQMRTDNLLRWDMYADPAAESGSNAGSNFSISRYDDSGAYLAQALTIQRNSGDISLAPSSGNVGIGATAPKYLLTNSSALSTFGAASDSFFWTTSEADFASTITNTHATSGYGLRIDTTATSSTSYPLYVTSGGVSPKAQFAVRGDGHVGIGTALPQRLLHLAGEIAVTQVFDNTVAAAGLKKLYIGNNGQGELTFGKFSDDMTTSTENMIITAAGNVGIGTTTPTGKLSIADSASASTPVFNISGSGGMLAVNMGDGNSGAGLVSGFLALSDAGASRVYVSSAGDSYFNGGNVGIGTTSPYAKLSVTGDLALTGGIYDNAASLGTSGMILQTNGTSVNWVATSSLGISSASPFSTSAELAALLSDETGSGSAVFSGSPTFTGTVSVAASTFSSTLTLSGTAANIALGSNYLSGDGADEGLFVNSTGLVGIGNSSQHTPLTAFHIKTANAQILVEDESFGGFLRAGAPNSTNSVLGWQSGDTLDIGVYDTVADTTITSYLSISGAGVITLVSSPTITTTTTGVGAATLCWDGSGSSVWGGCTSLRQYKDNIEDLSLGLETLDQLRPVEFDWNKNIAAEGHDFGFIAEEVEAVNPLLVEYGGEGGKLSGVKYNLLTSLIIKAVQELRDIVFGQGERLQNLESENKQLKNRLEEIESNLNIGAPAPTREPVITPEPETESVPTDLPEEELTEEEVIPDLEESPVLETAPEPTPEEVAPKPEVVTPPVELSV